MPLEQGIYKKRKTYKGIVREEDNEETLKS